MPKRVAIIGHPIKVRHLLAGLCGLFDRQAKKKFSCLLSCATKRDNVFLINSGIAAFYIILETLKKMSSKTDVMLPCYTAPSLVVAVRKAGLNPVLCDISLEDFNADGQDLVRRITPSTLCVVIVHMFGIPWVGAETLREKIGRDVFIIEDCAQAFGSKINTSVVGSFGDLAFYSFNRGKNLPTYEGGCIVTDSRELSGRLETELKKTEAPDLRQRLTLALKACALWLAFKPWAYSLFYSFIARFKEMSVPVDFRVQRYTSFQAALGRALMHEAEADFIRRFNNGRALIKALQGLDGIRLPSASAQARPVFNRLPLLFEEKAVLEKVVHRLADFGIETSRLYFKPLHHILILGIKKKNSRMRLFWLSTF